MAQCAAMSSKTHEACNRMACNHLNEYGMFGCMAQWAAMASKTHGVGNYSHGVVNHLNDDGSMYSTVCGHGIENTWSV